jgi:hypothetical protein
MSSLGRNLLLPRKQIRLLCAGPLSLPHRRNLLLMVYINMLFVSAVLVATLSSTAWCSSVPVDRRQAGSAHAVFPVTYKSGWTTSSSRFNNVQNLALSDSALGVNRVSGGTTHNVVQINGKTAWEAFYPKGSMNPSSDIRGGFGFYLNGPQSWNIAQAKEVGGQSLTRNLG